MTIYDYANKATEILLPDKEIRVIIVNVISGDETGCVVFTDDSTIWFDSSDCRMMNFEDGCYCVFGENIPKWLDYKPTVDVTASYDRMKYMEELE